MDWSQTKKRKYNEYNLKIVHAVATISTLLFFVIDLVLLVEEVFDIRYLAINVPKIEAVVLMFFVCRWLFLPVISIGCWYMYFERYIYLELSGEKNLADNRRRRGLLVSIIVEVLLGFVALGNVHGLSGFLVKHWEYIGELGPGVVIKCVIAAVWSICLIICVRKRKSGAGKRDIGIYKTVAAIVLLVLISWISVVGTWKVNEEAETVRFRKMLEYYDQYGEYKYS